MRHLWLTHGHIDHVFGAAHFANRYGASADHGGWQIHADDEPLLAAAVAQGELYGLRVDAPPAPAHRLAHGDEVALGAHRFRVLHVPGHSPGSVAFYSADDGLVLGGGRPLPRVRRADRPVGAATPRRWSPRSATSFSCCRTKRASCRATGRRRPSATSAPTTRFLRVS